MIRRRVAIAVACIVVGLIHPSVAATPRVQPQQACAKVGVKLTQGNRTFTCIRSRQGLVWSRGVLVKKPRKRQPASSASPTTTTASKRPAAPITFTNLDHSWTRIIAQEAVLTAIAQNAVPEDVVDVISGPSVQESLISVQREMLQIASTAFSRHFAPELYRVIYFSENDGAWADQSLVRFGGGYPNTISLEISRWQQCNFAFATVGHNGIPTFYQCLDSQGQSIADRQTAIHEYFHLVQHHYVSQTPGETMPCWLVEGSATYFGIALGIDAADPSGNSGQRFLSQLMWQYNPSGPPSDNPNARLRDLLNAPDGAATALRQAESPSGSCVAHGAYFLGSLASEALIAARGFDAFMDFIASFANTIPWHSDFERIYGISVEDFYNRMNEFMRQRASTMPTP